MPQIMPRRRTSRETLFPSEEEIAYRLGQSPRDWAAKAIVLEREGLPRIDPVMGGRYWAAVRAFFDGRSGLRTQHVPAGVDGQEVG